MHANQSACWNWFNIKDQMRDEGETKYYRRDYARDNDGFQYQTPSGFMWRAFQPEAAMAAIMSVTYPELYAATGVHSGLAHGSATDVVSAFAAMRGGTSSVASPPRKTCRKGTNNRVRTIVFHGMSDQTVHPSNAEMILADAPRRPRLPPYGRCTTTASWEAAPIRAA